MYASLCVSVLALAAFMACRDAEHRRYRTLWEASAGVLLVAGLAMIGYGLRGLL